MDTIFIMRGSGEFGCLVYMCYVDLEKADDGFP